MSFLLKLLDHPKFNLYVSLLNVVSLILNLVAAFASGFTALRIECIIMNTFFAIWCFVMYRKIKKRRARAEAELEAEVKDWLHSYDGYDGKNRNIRR